MIWILKYWDSGNSMNSELNTSKRGINHLNLSVSESVAWSLDIDFCCYKYNDLSLREGVNLYMCM